MKIALASAFLEDEIYGQKLDDVFMKNVICEEDHFYHRIAKSLSLKNFQPTVYYMSEEKHRKEFTHKYGHKIIRIPVKKIPFLHESIIISNAIIDEIKKNNEICYIVSGYYVKYKIPDMFDYMIFKLNGKIPIIARYAGGNHKWLVPIRKSIKKKALRKCDKIVCSSTNEIEILEQKFNIARQKIEHMYNPIDTTQFRPRSISEVQGKIEFDKNKKYILYVGRLIHNHGIELVLETFKKINQKYSNLNLILIGDGPMYDEIKQFINQNNLVKSVEMKGRLSHEIICFYYNISSILFHVGPSGGVPNVIMEAITSGLPVIANDNSPGNKDLINEINGTGILIKSNDKFELEKAILKILNTKNEIELLNTEAITKFSIDKYGEKMNKIIQEIYEEK